MAMHPFATFMKSTRTAPASPSVPAVPAAAQPTRRAIPFADLKDDAVAMRLYNDPTLTDEQRADEWDRANAPSATDRVVEAVTRMSQMDSKLLDLAENHPATFKAFLGAL
jgi:hypothetical protein